MANVVRLSNGTRIQVRTGVLQGVGPEGPLGPIGPSGPDGPAGPPGPIGPIGQILQVLSLCRVTGPVAVAANTNTLVAFPAIHADDPGNVTSSTLFTAQASGDYLFNVYVGWDAAEVHDLWIHSLTEDLVLCRQSSEGQYANISMAYRANSGEQFNVYVRSTTAGTVSSGAISITRSGSGPQGIQGPAGPTGPQGPQGAVGPEGPEGSADAGFVHYSDLLPD